MISISIEQIKAAQANDLAAVTDVIKATEDRVTQLATRYATTGSRTDRELAEDLAQVGRVEVWQALERFAGETVAEFFTFIDARLNGAMSDERRTEQREGVSPTAAKLFESALTEAGGNPYTAERIASSESRPANRRLSREMALAARLSWQGFERLDAPTSTTAEGDSVTLLDQLADRMGLPADLIDSADISKAQRQATRDAVQATLGKLGDKARTVLKGTYGIAPVAYFGTENENELADTAGIAKSLVRQTRAKAHTRFRELYLKGASA